MGWHTRLSKGIPAVAALAAAVFLSSGAGHVTAQGPAQTPSRLPPALSALLKNNPTLANNPHFQAALYDYQRRADANGDMPAGAEQRALAQTRQADAAQAAERAARNLPPNSSNWAGVGPAPQLLGQIGKLTRQRDVSGRVAAIAVDPTDSTHWLIGAAQGGIWSTNNSGVTWTPRTDASNSLAMGAIAFAANGTTVYAGTGEGNNAGDSYYGAGILKSTDGGATWTPIPGSVAPFANSSITGLLVDPANDMHLVAGNDFGIAGHVFTFPPAVPQEGVSVSMDGGATWSLKLTGPINELKADPTNFLNLLAGRGNIFTNQSASGLYRSTDGGGTWTELTSAPWHSSSNVGRLAMAIAPGDHNTGYVGVDNFTTSGLLGLWKTSTLWATTPTWTLVNSGATDNGGGAFGYCGWDKAFNQQSAQCWYGNVLSVDPANANSLYAGGIPVWKCDCTTPATPTWTEISHTTANQTNGMHVDQHAMAWAGTRLIFGNDGGVWSTTDGGTTINDHNTNLATTQYYFGAVDPTSATTAIGGAQDNGSTRWTGGLGWATIGDGDGALPVISPSSPSTHWAISSQHLNIQRTINGGGQYFGTGGLLGVPPDLGDGGPFSAPFIAVYGICPSNENVVIAGTTLLNRTNNFFSSMPSDPTWTNNGPAGFTFDVNSDPITAVAFASSDATCNTYAFGAKDGSVFATHDGGATWFTQSGASLPARGVSSIAFDPTLGGPLYIAFSGFNATTPSGHVFRGVNIFSVSPTYIDVSPAVDIPFNSIVLDPGAPQSLYAGTDIGVWQSANGGTTWTHMGPAQGMPNVAVFDLEISRGTNQLMAFTHGRGAFTLALPSLLGDTLAFSTQPFRGNYGKPLPVQPVVTASNGGGTDAGFNGTVTLTIKAGTGAAGAVLTNFTATASAGVATFSGLTVSLQHPDYVLTASATGASSVDSAVLNVLDKPAADGDGTPDILDVVCLLRQIVGLSPVGTQCPQGALPNADVNGDGTAGVLDALCELRYIVGLPATVPNCPFTP